MKLFKNVWFALGASIALLIAGSAVFAATVDTGAHWAGALASGLAVGIAGTWVGTAGRLQRRHRND